MVKSSKIKVVADGVVGALAITGTIVLAPVLRPWYRRWGATEAACRATRGTILLLDPDFPRYHYHAQNAQLSMRAVPLAGPPIQLPVERFLATITSDVGTIILSTVGNPTGYRLPSSDFIDAVRMHAPTALLVIDEVYSPFIGSDYMGLATMTPGILSLRSLSKVGFPGLRVGYAVGHPAPLATLARYVSPYAVAGPSLVAAIAAVRHAALWNVTIQRQVAARTWLVKQLHARGITCYPSPANWVLVAVGSAALVVRRSLAAQGILVQQPDHPRLAGYLRISTPNQHAVEQVVRAWEMLADSPYGKVKG